VYLRGNVYSSSTPFSCRDAVLSAFLAPLFYRSLHCLNSTPHAGTHPGFLRALDRLDTTQSESILSVQRLREERLRNVDEMYIAEMKAIEDEYRAAAEEIREKMIEELITKNTDSKAPKPLDMVTRKRAKMSGGHKEERPKKRTNIKGMRYSLTSDEIASDLETVRARMAGLSGSTRSKTKTAH